MRSLVITVAAFLVACGSGSESVSNPPAQTVSSITVTPSTASIQVNQTQQFVATDASGAPISGLTWASSAPMVASINSAGLAIGLVQSSTMITATSGTMTSNPTTLIVTTASTGTRAYSTTFPLPDENPISEGSNWLNGGKNGANWTNVNTTPGLAYGTMTSMSAQFADSTAVLTGTWGANQTAQAVVVNNTPQSNLGIFEELELRLNTKIQTNSITGYECNFSARPLNDNGPNTGQYAQIVKWNGPLASFTLLDSRTMATPLVTGDVVGCRGAGSGGSRTITISRNGVDLFSVNNNTHTDGSPGIGMFLQGIGVNSDYGFSRFTASDGP